VFECTCNTQNTLLLNQHNGDDAPQDRGSSFKRTEVSNLYDSFKLIYLTIPGIFVFLL